MIEGVEERDFQECSSDTFGIPRILFPFSNSVFNLFDINGSLYVLETFGQLNSDGQLY